MADSPSGPMPRAHQAPATTPGPDSRAGRTRGSPTSASASMPRWMNVCIVIAIILILLFVILHLTGNGFGDHVHLATIEHGVYLS